MWNVFVIAPFGLNKIAEYDNGAAVGSPSREYVYGGSIEGRDSLRRIPWNSSKNTG